MDHIKIPTADELNDRLGGLDRLLCARRWERAAIVWAFTTIDDKGGGSPGHRLKSEAVGFPCPVAQFARLGFAGLTSENSVTRYRTAWQDAIDAGHTTPVCPGDEIELPDLAWPPDFAVRNLVRDDDRRAHLTEAAEREGVSVSSVLRVASSPDAVRAFNSTLPPEEKAAQVRAYLNDPEVAEQVADRETVEKVARAYHDKQPTPKAQPRDTTRDYDALAEQGVNLVGVAVAAERSGVWTPSPQSEALLYFLARALDDRQRPPGDWDSLISEVEAFANREA